MRETLEYYQNHLNHQDILPAQYLARNHPCYALVCYVNIIIGLYLSHNYEPIPLFLRRAYQHFVMRKDKIAENENYQKMVLEYLSAMAHYIMSLEIEITDKDLIPPELL